MPKIPENLRLRAIDMLEPVLQTEDVVALEGVSLQSASNVPGTYHGAADRPGDAKSFS